MSGPPVFPGTVHGLRVWNVARVGDGDALTAAFSHATWPVDGQPMAAVCHAGKRHKPPQEDCSCGIYAYHPRAEHARLLLETRDVVVGIVEAWGQIEVHHDGFRAQLGRPCALVSYGGRKRKQLERLARRYDTELLHIGGADELLRLCDERGWGLSEATVDGLFRGPRRPIVSRRRLKRGSVVASAAAAVLAVVWAVSTLSPAGPPAAPADKPLPQLRVLDETVLERGGSLAYVGVVRNDDPARTAVGVRPIGTFRAHDGTVLGVPDSRFEVDNRPALAPGASGVVVDWLDSGSAPTRRPTGLRIRMTAARLRAGPAQPPARITHVRLDRRRCLVTATVRVARARVALRVVVLVRDRRERIVDGAYAAAGPLRTGRSRQVLTRVDPHYCRASRTALAFPDLGPRDVPPPRP